MRILRGVIAVLLGVSIFIVLLIRGFRWADSSGMAYQFWMGVVYLAISFLISTGIAWVIGGFGRRGEKDST